MKIVEKAATATDHGKEAAAGSKVFDGIFQVGGEVIDPFGEERDLNIGGAGIFVVQAVACDNLAFCLRSHKKKILCGNNFESMPDAGHRFVCGWGWGDCGRWKFPYGPGRRRKRVHPR